MQDAHEVIAKGNLIAVAQAAMRKGDSGGFVQIDRRARLFRERKRAREVIRLDVCLDDGDDW
jgi:hypothetical protein